MPKKQSNKVQSILTALSFLVLGATIALVGTSISESSQANLGEVLVQNDTDEEEQIIINVDEDDDAVMGDKDAPILMVEFSDYQCPFCRKFYNETLPQIKENYIDTGLVKFAYRDLPLISLGHSDATPAANAAECARDQEGDEMYFTFHDLIFEGQNELGNGTVAIPKESLYAYAEELGLDMDEFTSCQENLDFEDEIAEDTAVARSIGIGGTPAFVINGEVVTGAYPYETFEALFEQLLQ